jgi:DUF4097 and DUF4098 domain-containing protein YvlB
MKRSLLIATVLLGAASPAWAQRDDDYQSRIDTTFAFDRRGTLVLSVGSGEIVVTAWDRPQARVRARSERSEIRMDASSTRLSLELSRPRGGETRFEVTVPIGTRVNARATNGDISITGTKASVEANTQNGDLVVDDVGELIDLGSFSGEITARRLAGRVQVNSLSGDVSLSEVGGDVDATTVSGDIDLQMVLARYVRAKSTSGDVSYDGVVDSTGRYEVGSHSGSVYLTVPQTTGAMLTVATYTGTIDSDFPITLKPGEHGIGMAKRFTFEIGKGNARISAESFSGDITIRAKGRRPTDR